MTKDRAYAYHRAGEATGLHKLLERKWDQNCRHKPEDTTVCRVRRETLELADREVER